MPLTAPTEKPVTLPGVRANAGIQAEYRKRLNKLIERMHADVMRAIAAQYRSNPPMAADESPAMGFRSLFARLAAKWISHRFQKQADKLAHWFADQTLGYSDKAFGAHLKTAGFSVPFNMTREMNDAYQAVIGEQVGLIRSIPERYLGQVQTLVMQSVQRGRDLSQLSKQLQAQFGVTKRRAALISRDQSNKATAVMNAARSQALGITQAVWHHSHAGKVPRPSHVKAGRDKLVFDLNKGAYLDGEWVLPGQLINCHPGNSVVQLSNGLDKLYRRSYTGELVSLIADDGVVLQATPNHPILTQRGWVAAKLLDESDYLVQPEIQRVEGFEADVNDVVSARFDEIFDAAVALVGTSGAHAGRAAFEFHGDVADGDVDVVATGGDLPMRIEAEAAKQILQLALATPVMAALPGDLPQSRAMRAFVSGVTGAPERVVSRLCALFSELGFQSRSTDDVGLGLAAWLDSVREQDAANGPAVAAVFFGQREFTEPSLVLGRYQFARQILAVCRRAFFDSERETMNAEHLGEIVRVAFKHRGDLAKAAAPIKKFSRVREKSVSKNLASCHVFNLGNGMNWYTVNGIVSHNCRCWSAPIIKGFEP